MLLAMKSSSRSQLKVVCTVLVTVGYDSVALVLSSKLVNQVNQEGGGGGGWVKARVVVKPCFFNFF